MSMGKIPAGWKSTAVSSSHEEYPKLLRRLQRDLYCKQQRCMLQNDAETLLGRLLNLTL